MAFSKKGITMKTKALCAGAIVAMTAAACDKTVQPGDTSPPEIIVSEVTTGLPVVMATDPSDTAAALSCGGTGSLSGFFAAADAANYHVLAPGQTEVELLIGFKDPSGIQEARVTLAESAWDVTSPDMDAITGSHTPGGTVYNYLDWQFTETGQLQSPKLQTFALEFAGQNTITGRWIQLRTEDGAGNVRPSTLLWVVDHDTACN